MAEGEVLQTLDPQFLLAAFAVVFTVIYAFAAQRFLFYTSERRRRRQEKFYRTIAEGLLAGSLETVDDLVNVYKGVHGLGADDASYHAALGRALREYLVQLVFVGDLNPSDVHRVKEKVSAILKRIESEAPFADVPTGERNLLLDVQRFMRSGDPASAAQKLEDLAGLIEARQDALDRLQNSNKWAIPLTVIGLVLSIVFGVILLTK